MRWLLVMPSMMERAAVVATPSSARLLKGTQKYNIRVLNHSCLSARNCATSSGSCGERVEDHCYGAVPGGQSIDSCASQPKTSRAKSLPGEDARDWFGAPCRSRRLHQRKPISGSVHGF
jgi:hypothetical protein